MKIGHCKLILTAAMAAVCLWAQVAPSLVERTAVIFWWAHTDFHDGVMYTNGVYWKSFPASQTVMLTNAPDGTNTYAWQTLLPAAGLHLFTLRLADSNQLQSDPSPVCTQYVRLAAPGRFGNKEK